MGPRELERARRAYGALGAARSAWRLLPREARASEAGAALRDALRDAGGELAPLVLDGAAHDGMTDEERRAAADEAGREVDFHI